MTRKLFRILVALPLAVVLIALAVANREPVRLVFDPFAPQNTDVAITLPLYAYLFGAMFIGLLMGGIATWMSQSRWRKTARKHTREAQQWRKEAERLTRQLHLSRDVDRDEGKPNADVPRIAAE